MIIFYSRLHIKVRLPSNHCSKDVKRSIHSRFVLNSLGFTLFYISYLTKVVCSNPVHGEVYSIQQYVIKFVSDLRQAGGFLRFPPSKNLPPRYSWNIVKSGVKHHKPNISHTCKDKKLNHWHYFNIY